MPVRSLTSSILRWPDAATVDEALRRWARAMARQRPELRRVGYFGSYARGDWGPGSDLDVLVVIAQSAQPMARRAADWDLTEFPVPADLLVYTEAELNALDPVRRFARVVAEETVWVWPEPGAAADLATRRAAYARRLDEALRRAVAAISGVAGVQRVSVFGSYARGRRDLFTDLDLFVVWDTDRPPLDRLRYLYALLDVGVDLDIVCYTPAELRAGRDQPFIRQVCREEVVLYERPSG